MSARNEQNPSVGSEASQRDPAGEPSAGDWRLHLSALVDGELEATACSASVRRWAEHADARTTWHTYHLIGDALRSDELCGRGAEPAFLSDFRKRLATEPVVLAPAATTARASMAQRRQRLGWLQGSAVAAGFAAVAGVLWVLNPMGLGSTEETLARTPAQGSGPTVAAGTPSILPVSDAASAVSSVPASTSAAVSTTSTAASPAGIMERDPRLDAYLQAHRQWRPATGLAVPASVPATRPVDSDR